LWNRAWDAARHWLSPQTDIEALLIVAEQLDERVALRSKVLAEGSAEDRRSLRELDKQVMSGLSILGFTPTDRSRLGLAEVKAATKLDELRQRRQERAQR
jgi:hypothetical protein